jgi:hypothetical protein
VNNNNKNPVHDPNKTIINITNEFKGEVMEEITEKLMKKLQDMANQKV